MTFMMHIERFFEPGDHRIKLVQKFVDDLKEIRTEVSPIETWIPNHNAVPTILVNEIHRLLHVDKKIHFNANIRAKTYEECTLERRSIYRTAKDYMDSPLGLCAEPLVWSNLMNHCFSCPECRSSDIRLGGGSGSAWADIACTCGTLFEIKTVNHRVMKMLDRNQMRGGSYKYFQAQRRNGTKHYMIVVPKEGGSVILKKIKYIQPKIDANLLSFHKYAPEHASLKSHVVLNRKSRTLYVGENLQEYDLECRQVAQTILRLAFARYARTIQRLFKR
tara:strand:- start:536 stop:1363 length:828 start_codon:yes stop_codon:yes gene_type:complete